MGWLSKVFRRAEPAPELAADDEARDKRLRDAYAQYAAGNLAEAERLLRALGEQDPPDPDALYFLAVLATTSGRSLEAADLAQKAIEARPGDSGLWFMLAVAYHHQNLLGQAVDAWRTAARLDATDALVRTNLGAALIDSGKFDEGRVELERVLESGYETPSVQYNLCVVYRDQGRIDEAIAACRRAIELKGDDKMTYTNLLLTLNYSEKVTPAMLFDEHLRFGARFAKPYAEPAVNPAWPRRLRIGYVSPDFRSHVVACFVGPILAHHDRSRFEVFCYYTHRIEDPTTEYLRGLAEHWMDCVHLSDADLAQVIREDGIDILVDLAGHTGDNRLLVFAEKPAPVQISYLGYPNTTGISAVDYRITDAKADPPGPDDRFNVELLLRPRSTYFCFAIPRNDCPDPGPLPARAAGHVTFGCFNNTPKLSPPFIDAVAEVLKAVPGSRFRLKSRTLSVPHVAERLRERFRHAGIDLARIDLVGWADSYGSHLAAYQAIDIALDSFPYNGATTTCEALWMGVPVVTLRGDRHAARVGDSLLSAVGLQDLVADDVGGFVRRAASLAADLDRLEALRSGLRQRMSESPLRDEAGFTRALESMYEEIWQRKLAELRSPPPAKSPETIAQMLRELKALRGQGRNIEAEEACKAVLREQPDNLEALTALWDLSYETRNHGVAVEWLRRGIAANDRIARLHYMMGYSLSGLGNMPDAVNALRRAVELEPAMGRGHNNLGCALEAMGRLDEAMACYRRAMEVDAALPDPLYNLGNACRQVGDLDAAIGYLQRAIELDPKRADWKCNLGDLLVQKLRLDDAAACYEASIALDPGFHRAYQGRAAVLQLSGEARAAEADLRRAMELDPKDAAVHSAYLLCLHYSQGGRNLLEEHLQWARKHAHGIGHQAARAPSERRPRRRMNIGYVSPDFKRHSVADFFLPLLEAHDRERFKVFCYSNNPFPDETTRRIAAAAEEWREIAHLGDEWVGDRVRADRIDILVDLAGHTAGGRPLVFARKLAPVQATWLGYPDTTGLAAVDYRMTDAIADPEGAEAAGVESLVRLPRGFVCYRPFEEAPEPGEPPALRTGQVTFGSFNNLAKLTPEMVELWARLLQSVPRSRLMLKSFGLVSETVRRRLIAQFGALDVGAHRLELAGPEEGFGAHLARYAGVDIGLDVFPYNGAATTCEALWMGVPVVTLSGSTHVSRVGASLLSSAGLPELVAGSADDYLGKAAGLANDLQRLAALRASLRGRLRESPLLDAKGFARSLEEAYVGMWDRWVERQENVEVTVPLPVVPARP